MKALLFFIPILFLGACNQSPKSILTTVAEISDTTLLVEPFGMCSDGSGNFYIADVGKHCISRVTPEGEIEVFAGTGNPGAADGKLKSAEFNSPSGVCFDKKGNLYVAGFGGQNVRKISPDGEVTAVAGTGEEGYQDGPADEAIFSSPRGVCVDSKGNIFVADCWNHRIRKISPDGMVTTFAGGGKRGELVVNDWKDGADTTARFDAPCGLAIDAQDNIFVADANNNSIRKITPDGKVTTLAGTDHRKGLSDGTKEEAVLNVPTELFAVSDGTIYFSDTYNHCVRKITPEGGVVTLVGTGEEGFSEKEPLESLLSNPRGICVYNGYLYFVEMSNHTLRKLKL
ncbi:NHL repeat-containing protein [Draconibacterium sp. IB214405]|uniref:NHL repeat-containing protein n=1 Tax=Draconibacterium sp. IB214405 TaxID=3097352 RepID=UPI002A0DB289|nr:NHL repeat-containing protein [Draconibacterium sp. IB214405]MDX8338559.1 NHL repeat-containing protein [Draconibacterium sp. IB214405]